MMNEIQELTLRILIDKQGCKRSELITQLVISLPSALNFDEVINELISSGDIIEVEYILPNMAHRSFLLPKNTDVKVSVADIPKRFWIDRAQQILHHSYADSFSNQIIEVVSDAFDAGLARGKKERV